MEKRSPKTFFKVLFLFAQQHTEQIFSSRHAKVLGFITGLYAILLGLTMLGIVIKLYIDNLFGSSIHVQRPSLNLAHTCCDDTVSLSPATRPRICTYLFCDTDDHNGFVTGYLGRMQYALDERILNAKGYHVTRERLSTQSLRQALYSSDVVVFRGHGGVIDELTNHYLTGIAQLPLSKPPTLIFQACSIAKQYPPTISVSQMIQRFSALGISHCFAAEQDYVASTYQFNEENHIVGVDYIPWFKNTLPGLGLCMNPVPMSGLPATTFTTQPVPYRNTAHQPNAQPNITLPTNAVPHINSKTF